MIFKMLRTLYNDQPKMHMLLAMGDHEYQWVHASKLLLFLILSIHSPLRIMASSIHNYGEKLAEHSTILGPDLREMAHFLNDM